MEPAAHDKWEHQRSKDHKGRENFNSQKYLKGIYDWMKKCVRSLVELSEEDSLDFEGAGQYLPLDRETDDINNKKDRKDIYPKLSKDDVPIKDEGLDKLDLKDFTKDDSEKRLGEKTARNRKMSDEQHDKGNENNKNETDELDGELTPVDSYHNVIDVAIKRIISIDKRKYRISLYSNVQGKGIIELSISDETNRILKYNIARAKDFYGGSIRVSKNKIGPIKFKKGKTTTIEVEFEEEILAAFVAIVRSP